MLFRSRQHLPDSILAGHALGQVVLIPNVLKCTDNVEVRKQLIVRVGEDRELRSLAAIVPVLLIEGCQVDHLGSKEGHIAVGDISLKGPAPKCTGDGTGQCVTTAVLLRADIRLSVQVGEITRVIGCPRAEFTAEGQAKIIGELRLNVGKEAALLMP